MARRLGSGGYYVVLPNLYYRTVRAFDYTATAQDDADRARMFELMGTLDDDLIESDTAAMFAHVDADPNADASRVGCVGYCMSGPFAFAMACRYPDRISAAASGLRRAPVRRGLAGRPSPTRRRASCTSRAPSTTRTCRPRWWTGSTAHLDSIGANARVEWFPGTHHGFAFPQRPVYDKAAAERHWERLHSLFDRNLRAASPAAST